MKFKTAWVICILIWLSIQTGFTQDDFNQAPILYDTTATLDRVQGLKQRIESGEVELQWSDSHGWLPSVLAELNVPQESQTLVFSKTSQQISRITPYRPRALYFDDDVYVGWVQKGDFVELAAVDPKQGAIFYTLNQTEKRRPMIERDTGQCLSCHATAKTQRVPGFLVRSVFPKKSGHPEFRLGTTTTDHQTPFEKRFGGWYVTGTHGDMKHRGNSTLTSEEADKPDPQLNIADGANRETLPKRVNASRYLQPTSDIVALMLLEHQSQMHNHITRASFETRKALHYQAEMNRLFERDKNFQSESTARRIDSVVEKMVEYLLFQGEFELTSPIQGSNAFRQKFESSSIRDPQGRSLKQLDLNKRLLKYPCSYLIYSKAFLHLPKPVLTRTKQRMLEILNSPTIDKFEHLSLQDRKDILSILLETHPLFRL